MVENSVTKFNFPWKGKAIFRGCELRKLRKRYKELEESRDTWKEKAMKNKEVQAEQEKTIKALESELSSYKKKLK